MNRQSVVAMLLAGGQGSRLGALTHRMAKPAVPFGGKYRIIDFALSNCSNSGIHVVGVLTQYEPHALNAYIGNGAPWDLNRNNGGTFVLPPYLSVGEHGQWYTGTANAVYQNLNFIRHYQPDYVLILSGDHVYKMDYARMLEAHRSTGAEVTIAVKIVPMDQASRFGIMSTDASGRITRFAEKPAQPQSNKASMGIYIFSWPALQQWLNRDAANPNSTHDFGHDLIPAMLKAGTKLYAYEFRGFWMDVGTVQSLWDANMDLLADRSDLNLDDQSWRIYSKNPVMPPHYVADKAYITCSRVCEGAVIHGCVEHSVISFGAYVGENAVVEDCILMPNARVGAGAVVRKAIVGENCCIGDNARIGVPPAPGDPPVDNRLTGDITVINNDLTLPEGCRVTAGTFFDGSLLQKTGEKGVDVG